jgi:hypothetical protein
MDAQEERSGMKEILAAVAALGFCVLVSLLNKQLLAGGGFSWRGTRIQPRGSSRFPIVPTKESEVERENPARWLWSLVELLVFIIAAIWFLARIH